MLLVAFQGAAFLSEFFGEGGEFESLVKLVGLAAAVQCPATVLDTKSVHERDTLSQICSGWLLVCSGLSA